MSPLLKTVEQAGISGLQRKSNPQQLVAEDFFEDAEIVRQLFAELISAGPGRIALIPSVSYGMAIVGKNMHRRGEKIVTVHEEFPSDVYALHRLCEDHEMRLVTVRPPQAGNNRAKQWNQRILEAIDRETALVNLSSVHWADGTIFDLEAIGKQAKEVGALFVVDGSQSVGAMPFDVRDYHIDALICAGYKWLLGPYSSGLMYLGEYFDDGIPLEESWLNRVGSDNFRNLSNYENIAGYSPAAGRYNMGEYSNFINLPMLKTSLKQILAWQPAQITAYCSGICESLVSTLLQKGFLLEDQAFRSSHLFGCRLPQQMNLVHLQAALEKRRVFVSLRGESLRISPHVYNDANDVDELAAAIMQF